MHRASPDRGDLRNKTEDEVREDSAMSSHMPEHQVEFVQGRLHSASYTSEERNFTGFRYVLSVSYVKRVTAMVCVMTNAWHLTLIFI